MDAEILAVTLRDKRTMSKRRALRLLLAAPQGDFEAPVQYAGEGEELTQSEMLRRLFEDVLINDGGNVTTRLDEAVNVISGREAGERLDDYDRT